MSKWQAGHPEEGVLLRYLDGELAPWKTRQVRRHLAACWQCRAELESLDGAVADCMRYRKQVLMEHLPEAPSPWSDLSRGFERIDAELGAEPFWKRLGNLPRRWQWSLAAAAATAVLVSVFVQLRETPAVQAAALLKKAVASADSRPASPRRVRIVRRGNATPTVVTAAPAGGPMPAGIGALLETAHYDSRDPLSARAFQSWRDSVPGKTDEVTTVPDTETPAESCYRLRTEPASGAVASATLELRAKDLSPIEVKLEFRDRDWIEFTEVSEPPTKNDAAVAAIPVEAPMRPAEPSRPAAVAPRSTASISDELQVLSALHRIGADLGDPVDVKRAEGRVFVSGVGIAPQRQQQIHALLDGMANVTVEFAGADAPPSPAETSAAGAIAAGGGNARIETRLEQLLGGRAQFERFTAHLLDTDERAMARAYALRTLAERFPVDGEQSMSAADRELLRGMAKEHLMALAAQEAQIAAALEPVLKGLGGSLSQPPVTKSAASAWQPRAADLFNEAHRVEMQLSELLGVAPSGKSGAELPTQLLTALRDLRTGLEQCEKLAE